MSEASAEEATYCSVHPDRETGLRCNRCGRYMCAQCAVSTPVGYRCRECVRDVEDKFFSGTTTDNLIIAGVSVATTAALVFLGLRIGILGFWLVGFFAGVIYGGALSQALLKLTGKRRGRYTGYLGAGGVLIGAAIVAFATGAFGALGIWVFAGVSASVVYGRFR